jgi:lambda repressor-like predicted transcriptional regulator
MQQKQGIRQKEKLKKEFQTIKANFTKQGTSLWKFCAENNILHQSANKVFNGTWKGEKADALRMLLINASKGK